MRGTVNELSDDGSYVRITPAHAGNSPYMPGCLRDTWDHPRACGEQDTREAARGGPTGSPPRMRGTDYQKSLIDPKARITPAHAGNSRWILCRQLASGDHPRACGEQIATAS